MNPFYFRLHKVLQVREREETEAQLELKKAQYHLNHILKTIEGVEEEIVLLQEKFGQQQKENWKANDWSQHFNYFQQQQQQLERLQDNMLQQQNIIAQKQNLLIEATQRKKVLENLKEKHFLQWKEENQRQETKLLDEVALQRFVRKQ